MSCTNMNCCAFLAQVNKRIRSPPLDASILCCYIVFELLALGALPIEMFLMFMFGFAVIVWGNLHEKVSYY